VSFFEQATVTVVNTVNTNLSTSSITLNVNVVNQTSGTVTVGNLVHANIDSSSITLNVSITSIPTITIGNTDQNLSIDNKLFNVSYDRINTSSFEMDSMLVRNPAASGKSIYLKKMILTGLNTTAMKTIAKLYEDCAVTVAGTTITVNSNNFGAIPISSIAKIYNGPTISSRGQQMVALGTENTTSLMYNFNFESSITQGKDLLLTLNNNAINKIITVTLIWSEL
jgi:hypothetical protein